MFKFLLQKEGVSKFKVVKSKLLNTILARIEYYLNTPGFIDT